MATNYKETSTIGTTYQRAYNVVIGNPRVGEKGIQFAEEQVATIGDLTASTPVGVIEEPFTPENALTEFPLLNPVTNEPLDPPQTATYQDLYIMLFSLYYALAQKRDEAIT
jgi:hypothetical protein